MGIFTKRNKEHANETSLIAKNTKVVGEFELASNLHIDGEVEGKIVSSAVVSIGKSGSFKGEMRAKKVLVSGVSNGTIEAEVVEIMSGGRVLGDVYVDSIVIQSMAIFQGTCHQRGDN